MIEVSVIIPVYNVEKYLRECLDSVVNQTMKNIEIVCVNDGSTDFCFDILTEYAANDERIKIFNQKNAGLSAARNTGIENSTAPYIVFVDSDDVMELSAVEELYENIVQYDTDYSFCRSCLFNNVTGKLIEPSKINFDEYLKTDVFNEEDMPEILYLMLSASAWGKIFKRKFYIENNLYFIDGLVFEDIPFFAQLYLCAKKISLVNKPLYRYRYAREGAITQAGGKSYFHIFKAHELRREVFKKYNKWEKYKTRILLFEIKTIFIYLSRIKESLQTEFVDEIKKRYWYEDLSLYNKEEIVEDSDYKLLVRLLSL